MSQRLAAKASAWRLSGFWKEMLEREAGRAGISCSIRTLVLLSETRSRRGGSVSSRWQNTGFAQPCKKKVAREQKFFVPNPVRGTETLLRASDGADSC